MLEQRIFCSKSVASVLFIGGATNYLEKEFFDNYEIPVNSFNDDWDPLGSLKNIFSGVTEANKRMNSSI